jgi:ribonuclease HI
LFFDGGSRGNGTKHAQAGGGYLIKDAEGCIICKGMVYLGVATNNRAEYEAFEHGLIAAERMGIKRLVVKGDSELVIKQMKREYQVNSNNLKDVNIRARARCDTKFTRVEFVHIPRKENAEADALANKAIDEKKTCLIVD